MAIFLAVVVSCQPSVMYASELSNFSDSEERIMQDENLSENANENEDSQEAEAFEWLLLSSAVIPNAKVEEILQKPEDYIDCKEYVSWERFFTAVLTEKTQNSLVWAYSKKKLPKAYLAPKVIGAVKKLMKLVIWE